jgi:hypothetical protein
MNLPEGVEVDTDFNGDFICVSWKTLGREQSILFPPDSTEEEIAGVIQEAIIQCYVEHWHTEYTGHLSLEEYAGFTMEEYTQYLKSDGKEIGEINDARIRRITTQER